MAQVLAGSAAVDAAEPNAQHSTKSNSPHWRYVRLPVEVAIKMVTSHDAIADFATLPLLSR